MKALTAVALVGLSTVTFAQAPATTSQQRWDAFSACRAKEDAPGNTLGLSFIIGLVTGNLPDAYIAWAKLALSKNPSLGCLALLNPDEQAQQRQRDDYLRQMRQCASRPDTCPMDIPKNRKRAPLAAPTPTISPSGASSPESISNKDETADPPTAKNTLSIQQSQKSSAPTSAKEGEQPADNSSGPSLEETGHWIETNLAGLNEAGQDNPHRYNISAASMTGCKLSYTTEDQGAATPFSRIDTVALDRTYYLAWVPGSGAILGNTKGDYVESRTVNSARSDGVPDPGPSAPVTHMGHGNTFVIHTGDAALATRMIKALQHAIDLCKSTGRPDLF